MRIRSVMPRGDFEGINVTPLIDVVMCLIIFFLLVGKMAYDTMSDVKLPGSTVGRAAAGGKAVVISIGPPLPGQKNYRMAVDGAMVESPGELDRLLKLRAETAIAEISADPSRGLPLGLSSVPVQIRADRDLPYSAIEPALRACARLGLPGVKLATERPQ